MVGLLAFGGRVEQALPSETMTTVTGKAASGWLTTDFTEHLDLKVVSKGGAVTRRHETVFFYSEKDALTKEFEQSPNYVSLNGVWNFRYYESVQDMLADQETRRQRPSTFLETGRFRDSGPAIYVNHPYEFCPEEPAAAAASGQ